MTRVRLAAALWIALAVVVWNVVLDQTIVLAGRQYIIAALASAESIGPYVSMQDWMRPAAVRGVWMANAVAAAILLIGFVALRVARRARPAPTS